MVLRRPLSILPVSGMSRHQIISYHGPNLGVSGGGKGIRAFRVIPFLSFYQPYIANGSRQYSSRSLISLGDLGRGIFSNEGYGGNLSLARTRVRRGYYGQIHFGVLNTMALVVI